MRSVNRNFPKAGMQPNKDLADSNINRSESKQSKKIIQVEKIKQRKLPKIVITRASDENVLQTDKSNIEVQTVKKRRFKITNRVSEDSATK